jgi:glycosyltransferase involved in cell wall biosynthesis
MTRSIFIYEPYATGHHTGFLRVLLTAFAQHRDWHTTLLTSEDAEAHPAFARVTEEFRRELDVIVARRVNEPSLVRRVFGRYYAKQYANSRSLKREFRTLHRERHFDFALTPYMEAVGIQSFAVWSFFGQVPWAVIPHALRFHFHELGIKAPARRIDVLQRLCFLRMLRAPTLAAVFTLDPYLVTWSRHPKVLYVPDPSKLPPKLDQNACRRSLGLPEDAIVVLAYGAIDDRKCLDLLLPGIAQVVRKHRVLLVIAGVQDPRLRRSLLQGEAATQLRRESRLVEFDRFVSSAEEEMLFSSADVVWNYYRNQYGSSGVLVRAGQYSKPVIVSDTGLVGRIVTDERCGVVVPRPEPEAVSRVLIELATRPTARREMAERAFARFAQNVPEAFASPITAAVVEAAQVVGWHPSPDRYLSV